MGEWEWGGLWPNPKGSDAVFPSDFLHVVVVRVVGIQLRVEKVDREEAFLSWLMEIPTTVHGHCSHNHPGGE